MIQGGTSKRLFKMMIQGDDSRSWFKMNVALYLKGWEHDSMKAVVIQQTNGPRHPKLHTACSKYQKKSGKCLFGSLDFQTASLEACACQNGPAIRGKTVPGEDHAANHNLLLSK